MKLHPSVRGTCALVALALAATTGGTALAADAAAEATTFHPPLLAAPAMPTTLASSLQAAIDPDTGALRAPTLGERLDLAALAAPATTFRRAVASSEVQHADGSVSAAVDTSLFSATTVVIDADGQAHFSCGHAGHAGHLHPTTVTAPAAEDR